MNVSPSRDRDHPVDAPCARVVIAYAYVHPRRRGRPGHANGGVCGDAHRDLFPPSGLFDGGDVGVFDPSFVPRVLFRPFQLRDSSRIRRGHP